MSENHWEKPKITSLSLRRVTRYMIVLEQEWKTQGMPELSRPPRADFETRGMEEGKSYGVAIPDPWDVQSSARQENAPPGFAVPDAAAGEPLSEPAGVSVSAAQGDPWGEDPVTVARGREQAAEEELPRDGQEEPAGSLAQDGLFWSQEPREDVELPVPWELPELMAEAEEEKTAGVVAQTFSSPKEQEDFNRAMMYLSQDDDFLVTGVGRRTPPARQQPQDEAHAAEMPPVSRPQDETPPIPSSGTQTPPVEPQENPQAAGLTLSEPSAKQAEKKRGLPMPVVVLAIVLAVLLLAGVGLAVWYFFLRDDSGVSGAASATAIYLGEENLGCVEDGLAIQLAVEMMREGVEMDTMLPAMVDKEIRLEPVRVDARYIAPQREMEQAVLNACSVLVQAYGVYVDGRVVGVARSEADVNALMEEGLAPYRAMASSGRDIKDLRYAEMVEVKAMAVSPDKVLDKEALRCLLIAGEAKDAREYEVASGDSLIAIANKSGMTLGQIRYANPQLIGRDLIQVGAKLSLTPPQGLLTVQFTEHVTEEIKSPFETVVETSDKMFTTQSEEKVKGVNGVRRVVADKVYVAGVNVGETILEETVITEAVARVVVKGTKKVENTSGSSTYVWPAQGRVSSEYGSRWGRTHHGIDIAASTGTPIYAVRDGKVTFSGTNGNYGKMIKIDHGGGIETRYAHCSVLKVSSGTSVKKGQLIALVGSTGNSTGPHLHFEVRVGGDSKNPRSYLPK